MGLQERWKSSKGIKQHQVVLHFVLVLYGIYVQHIHTYMHSWDNVGYARGSPKNWSNLKHLFLVSHDSHLLVELGGLCQTALPPHVVELEDRGASL